jgi:dimethylamine/trimethylamine dehydrogenase
MTMSPIRCTQNPSMGEEWRRGWHPERIRPKRSDSSILVVGAGPAGLECARALGQRGYRVTLAEAGAELGGRVTRECRLPHAAAWGRVRDHRVQQLTKLPRVEIFRESPLDAGQILDFGFPHVVIATGAFWRRDGVARYHLEAIPASPDATVLTPDDLMDGARPQGRILIYDDDHYYMGGLMAELLVAQGAEVTLATPASEVSNWARNTLEQHKIQARLLTLGVAIETNRALTRIEEGGVETACIYTGHRRERAADAVVLVTARLPREALYRNLLARRADWAGAGLLSVRAIGDAWAPSTIAAAVHAGRRYAEEFEEPHTPDAMPFRRELTALAAP